MYCKKCGTQIVPNQKFCSYCGEKIILEKNFKEVYIQSIISLIIFVIILALSIFSLALFYKDDSGAGAWYLIILIMLTMVPFIISVVLSFITSNTIKKYKQSGINIPKKMKTLGTINILQLPLIILVLIIGAASKEIKYNKFINQKLDELYNSNYQIIDKCSISNEGGTNYEIVVFEIENFDYPVIGDFDWAHDNYEDNYEELKQANNLNYQSYIDNIFDDKIISLMNISNDEDDRRVNLNILISENKLNNQRLLKSKIREITNKYIKQFPDYIFSFRIYFSNKIDEKLIKDYYIYLSDTGSCHSDFGRKINSSITKTMYIYIDEDTNINTAIDDSFYNIKSWSWY